MYWEFEEISAAGMSNNSEFLLSADQQDHQKMIQFAGLLLRPNLEFPERCEISASDEDDDDELHHQRPQDRQHNEENNGEEEDRKENGKERETMAGSSKERKLGEFKQALDDEDDGFRTPTSLDHKIPVASKCPSAPRKPKSLPSRKRKACAYSTSSSSKPRQSIRITDVSEEIDLLFPPAVLADLGRKIKKVRDDNKMMLHY